MFAGFSEHRVKTAGAEIFLRRGGEGPPVLLLHGYPETHAMWHRVAPQLARGHSIVVPDLRGYGRSSKPPSLPDHTGYDKRTMAKDMVEIMAALGWRHFALAGHDRGGRVAYRMALDHPGTVTRLAVLDIVPTHTMWTRLDRKLASAIYHWTFLIQPDGLPEKLIGADPEYYLREKLRRWSGNPRAFAPEAVADYLAGFQDPASIHATCEDYRAGATLDFEHDQADFGRRKIACPMLVLWGETGVARRIDDVLAVWRQWADDVRGRGLPCGHFLPEEAPEETAAELKAFL